MLTALFKSIWNTQKTTLTKFFEHQGKTFLNTEKVLLKISEDQPKMLYLLVFLHIFEIKESNFFRNIYIEKQNGHEIYLKVLK